ncbi:Radical SAM domain protein [Hydrogenobacter thermophilus TK-6]|uniref:Radical SAM domain protein n=1 Tax=Hydrogenobacter thermophilus (strain DSM 6534 / IAM 12695 / TK-6) TaxID=608538 RepID=D3DJZ0_HYDTT|nr:radical SAM protein [Hydrogenobacter thermophilus]ADO46063.1 Radical SAM domain protein [Hydrogenobacter thermophilus TK-6]BAI70142.1 radical SAM domain protein [Hydrogenobacter thermophilus TK-6]
MTYPSYLNLTEQEWKERIEKALSMLEECRVCPHNCGVNRLKGELGYCKTGRYAVVDAYFPHLGEEKPIRGRRGSGTVFFSYCNMRCAYCQNYVISHLGEGRESKPEELAHMFLKLQSLGCHNINLVSPSHMVPQILEALYIAVKKGLRLPIVYNTSSFDGLESLRLLDGIVDIYLADFKYSDNKVGKKYSKVKNYFDTAINAIKEMHRQVGDLETDEEGIAKRGLMVRHLVLPNSIAGTEKVMEELRKISPNMAVNVMNQYMPYYKAFDYPELSRRINTEEYRQAMEYAKGFKLVLD